MSRGFLMEFKGELVERINVEFIEEVESSASFLERPAFKPERNEAFEASICVRNDKGKEWVSAFSSQLHFNVILTSF